MIKRAAAWAALISLGVMVLDAGAAHAAATADQPVATAPTLATAGRDVTADQIDAWLKADASAVQPLDNDIPGLTPAPRAVHGEVGAYVSNRGYGGYAASSMPLGQASELDVAVGASHERLPWGGTANPKSLAIGLYLDGGDVGRFLSRSKCDVPRWGVALPGDPQVKADGSCQRADTTSAKPGPFTAR